MTPDAQRGATDPGAPYLFIASMDVSAEKEALFNEVYDQEHAPNLAAVPGVLDVERYESTELTLSIGGTLQRFELHRPKYHAIFALTSPDVLVSDAWGRAIETGRWPDDVRPHTFNRQHRLCRRRGL
jgi:hypothetical protein